MHAAVNPPPQRPEAALETIDAQLDLLAEALRVQPGVLAVVVMGSAARGELASCEIQSRQQHLGDFELLVVTARRFTAARRARARAAVDRVVAGFGQASPRFHVDLLFRARHRLPTLPPIIFTHELREAGRVLRGPNVLAELPRLTAADLDAANTREILFKRLWALAEELPADWLRGQPLDELTARGWGVGLRRQPLDVPTVLLPACGMLAAGYGRRLALWRAHPELPFRAWLDRRLGGDSAAFLDRCLRERAACAPPEAPARAHREAFVLLAAALEWSLERLESAGRERPSGALESDPLEWTDVLAARLATGPRGLFAERPIAPGQWLALARHALRAAWEQGPAAALAWLRAPRKALLAAALVQLHRALLAEGAGRHGAARAALVEAMQLAGRAAAAPELAEASKAIEPSPFGEAWLLARRAVGRAFWRLIRLGEPRAWLAIEARLAAPLAPPR